MKVDFAKMMIGSFPKAAEMKLNQPQKSKGGSSPDGVRVGAWSEDEIQLLRDLWARRLKTAHISKILGRTHSAVSVRASRMNLPPRWPSDKEGMSPEAVRARSGARTRPCMKCGNAFHSEGVHNRVCNGCKEGDDWRMGGAYSVNTY